MLNDGTNSYILGPGGLPIEQSDGEKVLYLHHDQAGSTRLLTGSTGKAEATFTYDAYGNQTGHTGTATTPVGYDGQYTSADTGLIYLRARVYDPATTQFLSADPIASLTRAPYTYASDNPLTYTDPTGLIFGISGTPSFGEIGHVLGNTFGNLPRDAEYVAAGTCVVASAGVCLAVAAGAFAANTTANAVNASSVSEFAGKELFTIGETAVGGAPGYLLAVPEALGALEFTAADGTIVSQLPESWLGRSLLNFPGGLSAAAITALEPYILAELAACNG